MTTVKINPYYVEHRPREHCHAGSTNAQCPLQPIVNLKIPVRIYRSRSFPLSAREHQSLPYEWIK